MGGRLHSFFVTAVIVHVLFLLSGWLIGWGLDELVWFLSHDYVFPPNLFARRAILAGWLGAASVVCLLGWYGQVRIPPHMVLQLTVFSVVVSLLVFVIALALIFAAATIGWHFPGATIVGPRRHHISAAIPYAGFFAAALGCLTFSYLGCRRRIEQ